MLLQAVVVLALCLPSARSASCTLCFVGLISKPEYELNLQQPFPLATCQDLENVAGFVDDASDDCTGIRTLGGLCGCPPPPDACRLCADGQTLVYPSAIPSTPSPILDAAPEGVERSCGFLDSWIQSTATSDAEECLSMRTIFELDCLCTAVLNEGDQTVQHPSSSPSGNEAAEPSSTPPIGSESCSVCPNGGAISNPGALIPIDIPESPIPIETCKDLETAAVFVPASASECVNGIQLLAGLCGCSGESSSVGEGCLICPGGEVPEPDTQFYNADQLNYVDNYFDQYGDDPLVGVGDGMLTCQFVSLAFSIEVARDSEECFVNQLRREICGCEPHPKLKVLNWCRRTSAILSLLCSTYIVVSVLRDSKRVGKTYHQLVLLISFFDIIGSLANCFDWLLLPSGASIPHALGNITTCRVQGTMIQLSFCGVLFNLLLALYFRQTVVKGWKEHQFVAIRRFVVGAVLFLGVGLAFGGIPLYEPLFSVCGIPVPPLADSWMPSIFFFFVPFGISLIVILWATVALFLSVYNLEQSSSKWRLQLRSTGDSMTEKVFWRCFFYLLAFCVPWPMYFASYFVQFTESNYPFFVALQLCIPCQGILNFLVYRQRSIGSSNAQPTSSASKSPRIQRAREKAKSYAGADRPLSSSSRTQPSERHNGFRS